VKHAVTEPDVGPKVTLNDPARPQEVGAHATDAMVGGLQAIFELLRQNDERGANRCAGDGKAAGLRP
jgi:hypothetical protein